MSTLDELASPGLGRLKADAVATVWLDDSATEIGELPEQSVSRTESSDQFFTALLPPQDLHQAHPHRHQARSTGRCELIVRVCRSRGETDGPPGKARNHCPAGGAVGAAEEGEGKGRSGVSTATGGSLAALGWTWDRTNI
jgi:hypothetical protein